MIAAIRHTRRLAAILHTLRRRDALFPVERLGNPTAAWLATRLARRGEPGRPGERLARALQDLGPSFIKLGQTLSTRPDLLGEEIATDLATLQDRLPPFPAAAARATVEAELGAPIAARFERFDDVPVAAASIAQVHFAITAEGAPVAVKILRPGIEAAFERDLAMFTWLARWVERLDKRQRRLRPVEVVAVMARTVAAEMDLRLEAAAAAELAANFAGDVTFRVPKVDWQRTGRRVLTIERVSGVKIDEREALIDAGHDPRALLAHAADSFFRQVFRDGFFHADMHAGNIFVASDGALVVIDFGIMGRLDRRTRTYLADMLAGFLARDYDQVADVHWRAGYVPADVDLPAFAQAVRAIGEPILDRPLNEISLGRLLAQLFQVTEQFRMETQPHLLLLQKTMLMAEGMGRRLDPSVNMWSLASPLIEQWMRDNRGPQARLRDTALDVAALAERLPGLVDRLDLALTQIAAGELVVHRAVDSSLWARLWPLWLAAAAIFTLALLLG